MSEDMAPLSQTETAVSLDADALLKRVEALEARIARQDANAVRLADMISTLAVLLGELRKAHVGASRIITPH